MNEPIALILLAAGQSARFGGDKLAFRIEGVSLLSRALRLYGTGALKERIGTRILVLNPERKAFLAEAEAHGFAVVWNDRPEDGQARSIRLGIEAAVPKRPTGLLFSVADQPYLGAKTVERILDAFQSDPTRIVAPAANGRRGNPVLFPSAYADELKRLLGDTGGNVVIRAHADRLTVIETAERELQDIDVRTEEMR